MSAIVHFVVFDDTNGVIESAATGMPGATDFVQKGDERKPIVKSASGKQRFACGPEPSKWWALKDEKGILHVATGEPERVSCEACKLSKEYLCATGQLPAVAAVIAPTPSSQLPDQRSETGQSNQQGTINVSGAEGPGQTDRAVDSAAEARAA